MENKLQDLINNPQDLIDFILDLIGEDYDGAVGLRGLYKNEKAGNLRPSMVWEDGNMTDEELDGTCAIIISADWKYNRSSQIIENIKKYAENVLIYGNGKVGLVVGEYGETGEDAGEIIISDAKAIHIWRK